MNSQRAMRAVLSLTLVLSIGCWAETGLAMILENGQSVQCHARMAGVHQHMMHSAMAPCCPSEKSDQSAHFADHSNCCDVSSQPARPLSFLVVSARSLSVELRAATPATARFAPPLQNSASPVVTEFPPFVKRVSDLKIDLRI